MRSAKYTSAANRDVKRALDYYKREAGVKVAEDLISHLEAKVALILRSPEAYQVVTRDLRCANLDRFPYQIVYRICRRIGDQNHLGSSSQTESGFWT